MNDLKAHLSIIYNVFIASSIFMVGSFIAGLLGEELNIFFVITLTTQLCVVQYVNKKFCLKNGDKKRKIINASMIFFLASPLIYYMANQSMVICVFYYIFSLIALLTTRSFNTNNFSYEEYVFMVKMWSIIGICSSICIQFLKPSIKDQCNIVFLYNIFVSIVLLRKSRNYENGIKTKHDKWFNLSMIAMAIFFMTPWVNNFFQILLISIKNKLEVAFTKTMEIIAIPIVYIYEKLRQSIEPNNIINEFGKKEALIIENVQKLPGEQNKLLELIVKVLDSVGKAILILIVLLIIFFVFRGFIMFIKKKLRENNTDRAGNQEYCEIEKIKCRKKHKRKEFINQYEKSNIGTVKKIYFEFLNITQEREIYKASATPTALSNKMKTVIESPKELDVIKDIYNEGKFSNHEVTDDMVETMKKAYNIVYSRSQKKNKKNNKKFD
ncbi:hypothetical protein SAMN02745248_01362 [Hathewaya proteolytica DSM 3090]|uniref:DUF4129 domain-containing protein n=1 Tax=Hathewaya proteolytica DSM 3090 TaxID=1121331 RepID=A0A1M6NE53_9CLOT|nr:hypothetical protein [Hathewaya proteolytica]SHJ94007.1 hypothetical protein SAMN02745248_01362 [Hathewaya proteolytica DSM 3090]